MNRIDKILSLVEKVSSIFHLKPKRAKDDKLEAKIVAEQMRIAKEGIVRHKDILKELAK